VVIRALSVIRRSFPDVVLELVGDGPDEARLRQLSARLGLADAVRFRGYLPREQIVDLLYRSHLFLNPSPKEGWGLTVIEANALGTPVVARDAPGLRDSIHHEKTGLLVEGDEPEPFVRAFARAVARLLADDSFTRAMRREALAWSKRFDWTRAADDMEAAIEICLEGGSR
jgi:glycosyltransferase involved in cell wall biosynthesis